MLNYLIGSYPYGWSTGEGKSGSIYGFWSVDRGSYAIFEAPIGDFRVRGVFLFYFVRIGVMDVIDVRTSIHAGFQLDTDITVVQWV